MHLLTLLLGQVPGARARVDKGARMAAQREQQGELAFAAGHLGPL